VLPGLQFCGQESGGLASVSEDLLRYVVALLRETPEQAPTASVAEWKKLLAQLTPHWVLPFLHFQVGSIPDQYAPPDEIRDYLRMEFLRSSARAKRTEEQLASVLKALGDEGVQVLVLKGPALARGVYPAVAARPYSDLDLLVRPEMMVRTRKSLEQLGYALLDSQYEATKSIAYHETFRPPPGSNSYRHLEVHWDLTKIHWSGWELRIERLFDRSVSITTDSVSFDTLNSVDALMYRSLNNAWVHYRDLRLIWIIDVALLARDLKCPDDWTRLQERCVEWHCRLAVESSIELAKAWTATALPAGFDDVSAWPIDDAERDAWTTITSRHLRLYPYIGLVLRNSSGPGELLRAGLSLLFPSPGLMRLYHPPAEGWRLPIAYVRRWWKWVRRAFGKR
jgi:hypothetical protein